MNNDGWLDILVDDHYFGNFLYQNNADETFDEVADELNIRDVSSSWEIGVFYYDSLWMEIQDLKPEIHTIKCYPNPFSNTLTIEYEPVKAGIVNITIFNHFGQIVESIDQGNIQQGEK